MSRALSITCPGCRRRYDASDYSFDDEVRCVCGRLIQETEPTERVAAAMRCAHCGGAVPPDAAACPYCQAGLRCQTLCPSCFARIDEGAPHCSRCGEAVLAQTVQLLKDGTSCPRCKGAFSKRRIESFDVVECNGCGGLWLDVHLFEHICREAERSPRLVTTAKSFHTTQPAAPLATGYLPCVRCSELMMPRQFRSGERSSGVVLDFCKDHGVWFDHVELEKVVAFLRDRGPAVGATAPSGLRDGDFAGGSSGTSGAPPVGPLQTFVGLVGDVLFGDLF